MNRLFDLPRPLILAHRGASAHAPENTLAAFRLAEEHGAHGIELDAKLSWDGEVVVFHDLTLERVTHTQGRLKDFSLEQLRELEVGSHKAEKFRGEPIPTLDEVFEAVGRRLYINIELTNYDAMWDRLVAKVVEKIKRHDLADWVMFSSFWPLNLINARRLLPGVPVGILALEGKAGRLARSVFGRWVAPGAVNPYYTDATAGYIRREHQLGRRVNVWTVNDPLEMKRLTADGVDGIITDDPRLAREVIRGQ